MIASATLDDVCIPYDDADLKRIELDPDQIDIQNIPRDELIPKVPNGYSDSELFKLTEMTQVGDGWYYGTLQCGVPHY